MVSAPALRNPDFSKPFLLQTDPSDYAIGAVLSQTFNNKEHPIAFLSRSCFHVRGTIPLSKKSV